MLEQYKGEKKKKNEKENLREETDFNFQFPRDFTKSKGVGGKCLKISFKKNALAVSSQQQRWGWMTHL